MDLDLKRAIALKRFLNQEYFECGDVAYEGTREEADDLFSDSENTWEDFLELSFTKVEELFHNTERDGYMVLTDEEADEMWEEALDNYLEECVYSSLPNWMSGYFNEEKWKRDAKMDGRGHWLATYDGHEHHESYYGEDFYIYKIN